MSSVLLATFGVGSAVANTAGTVPYVIDIFRGKTKPERATWWIFFGLFIVGFIAQVQVGAHWSLFFAGALVFAGGLIAILSVRYGYGTLKQRDYVSIGLAVVGVILWWRLNQPIIGVLLVILIDLAGFWLTVAKTWHAPHTETLVAWQLSALSSALGTLAVGSYNFGQLAYPLYSVLGTLLMVFIIMHRREAISTVSD